MTGHTPYDDIVSVLRDYQGWMKDHDGGPSIDIYDINGDDTFGEAADKIEKLREINAELLEALEDAVRGLEWWIAEYPESASEIDNEAIASFKPIIAKATGDTA